MINFVFLIKITYPDMHSSMVVIGEIMLLQEDLWKAFDHKGAE